MLRLRAIAPVPITKRDVLASLAANLNIDVAPFQRLLNLRSGEKLGDVDAETLFTLYLGSVEKLIDTVDALER